MGRKRKPPESEAEVQATEEGAETVPRKDARRGDRHTDRHMVAFRGDVYEAVSELARRENRPVSWQIRQIMIAALREAGLWADEEESAQEEE